MALDERTGITETFPKEEEQDDEKSVWDREWKIQGKVIAILRRYSPPQFNK